VRIAILLHTESEMPGTIEPFLRELGADVRLLRLYAGDRVPSSVEDLDAIVSMGGTMNVYEDRRYPFLAGETDLLRQAIRTGLPVLGVCLGAQLIARSSGARVKRNRVQEIGWSEVRLTEAARADPVFGGLPPIMQVFQFHGDTFDLPEGATLLAVGSNCRNQAFRIANAYAIQFHCEVTRAILHDWFPLPRAAAAHVKELPRYERRLQRCTRILCRGLVALAQARKTGRAPPGVTAFRERGVVADLPGSWGDRDRSEP